MQPSKHVDVQAWNPWNPWDCRLLGVETLYIFERPAGLTTNHQLIWTRRHAADTECGAGHSPITAGPSIITRDAHTRHTCTCMCILRVHTYI
eukprot:scaffold22351_cov126-Isochrysis_galbana.AAC.2